MRGWKFDEIIGVAVVNPGAVGIIRRWAFINLYKAALKQKQRMHAWKKEEGCYVIEAYDHVKPGSITGYDSFTLNGNYKTICHKRIDDK
jgi:hypothetical protein